jgi:DNA (cytosine-5)-methyltransferase 1
LGYATQWKVLNALDFGLPQKRERVFIVGLRDGSPSFDWDFPRLAMKPLSAILERRVARRYFASERIIAKRRASHTSSYPFNLA